MKVQVAFFSLLVIVLAFAFLGGVPASLSGVRPALAAEVLFREPLAPGLFEGALAPLQVTKAVTPSLEVVGQLGGDLEVVGVQGNYAYVGLGPRLVILNISNPAQPISLGQTAVLPGAVRSVAVAGNYAYVGVTWSGLHIINITNPAAPVEVGFAGFTWWASDITVVGSYAYVVGPNIGLHIFNVSNPASPVEVGSYSFLYEGTTHLDVAGAYAYVATDQQGLRIINISNPAVPVAAGVYHPTSAIRDVKVRGDYAYVASNGFHIVNITNPAAPLETGSFMMEADTVAVASNLAYITGSRDDKYGLRIVDVSNPAVPKGVGFYQIPGLPYRRIATDIAVAGNCVYIAQKPAFGENQGHYYISGGLNIINVSVPAAPTQASFYPALGAVTRVTVADHFAYAVKATVSGEMAEDAGGLNLVNAVNPAVPVAVGTYYPPGWKGVRSTAAAGHYAYIGAKTGSDNFAGGTFRVVNIANPSAPVEVGFVSTPGPAQDVVVVGTYAYIAEVPGYIVDQPQGGGLRIFNIANPAVPTEVGFYAIPEGAERLAVAGHYAYLAVQNEGLWILDVGNPAAPHKVGAYTGYYIDDVAVAGNYAYVTTQWFGLRIVNITNPANPTEVGSYESKVVLQVAVEGNYAYIGVSPLDDTEDVRGGGLGVVDISDPTTPTEASFYDTPGLVLDVAVADGYIYVADDEGGLLILRFMGASVPVMPVFLPVIHAF